MLEEHGASKDDDTTRPPNERKKPKRSYTVGLSLCTAGTDTNICRSKPMFQLRVRYVIRFLGFFKWELKG
jgi:hypothetical protein